MDLFAVFSLLVSVSAVFSFINYRYFKTPRTVGLMLFAGALRVEANALLAHKWMIAGLATLGVLFSTFLVGVLAWLVFDCISLPVPLVHCLLFGALISTTDPVAVLGILKELHAPKSIETQMVREALFNDGVGVVVFVTLLGFINGGEGDPWHTAVAFFAKEALGGIAVALALSFPDGPYRGIILVSTYFVVVFSILVRGLTIRRLYRRWFETA